MASPTPDLRGRICLVTGANRGIGLATSIALARAGGHVVMVCRDEARARARWPTSVARSSAHAAGACRSA
jgi:NAD(P)-dependent dehydrogenase (short-subunit alcohol dehydrogenase family)